MQFLAYLLYSLSQKIHHNARTCKLYCVEHRQKNSYAMHTIKITHNLLLEYQCTSGKFIRLPNRIESKVFLPELECSSKCRPTRLLSAAVPLYATTAKLPRRMLILPPQTRHVPRHHVSSDTRPPDTCPSPITIIADIYSLVCVRVHMGRCLRW